jgi:hypothetical protein
MGNCWFKGNPYFNRVSSNATKSGTAVLFDMAYMGFCYSFANLELYMHAC